MPRGMYTVYCASLPGDVRERELDDLFGRVSGARGARGARRGAARG